MRPFIIVLIFIPFMAGAGPMDVFVFDSEEQEQTFNKLSNELRCLVCQNQSIADSNADLAKDLRTEIYNMLKNGKGEQEVVKFMVERYGDYVLYRPPLKPMTWLLWFGPILVFVVGLVFVIRYIRSQREEISLEELSEQETERLKNLQAEGEAAKAGKKSIKG